MIFDKFEVMTISVRDKNTKKLHYFRFLVGRGASFSLDELYALLERKFENGFYKHSFDRRVIDFVIYPDKPVDGSRTYLSTESISVDSFISTLV